MARPVNLSMREDTLQALDMIARVYGLTRSGALAMIVRERYEEEVSATV